MLKLKNSRTYYHEGKGIFVYPLFSWFFVFKAKNIKTTLLWEQKYHNTFVLCKKNKQK